MKVEQEAHVRMQPEEIVSIDRNQFIAWKCRSSCEIHIVHPSTVERFTILRGLQIYKWDGMNVFKLDESHMIISRDAFGKPEWNDPFVKVNIFNGQVIRFRSIVDPGPGLHRYYGLDVQIGPTTFLIHDKPKYTYDVTLIRLHLLHVDLESNTMIISPTEIMTDPNLPFVTSRLYSNYRHRAQQRSIFYHVIPEEYQLHPYIFEPPHTLRPIPYVVLPDNYKRFFFVGEEVIICDDDNVLWRMRPEEGGDYHHHPAPLRWFQAPGEVDVLHIEASPFPTWPFLQEVISFKERAYRGAGVQ